MTKARDIASASPAPSTVSATELGYLDGVSSAIQTQLDGKASTTADIPKSLIDAKGDLIVGSAADTAARLAVGTNNHVLTADSSATNGVKWAAAGGGKVLQVVSATYATQTTTTSANYEDTGLSGTITPSSASSKILVMITNQMGVTHSSDDCYFKYRIVRGTTTVWNSGFNDGWAQASSSGLKQFYYTISPQYLDSPATTSATTYKLQFNKGGANATVYAQYSNETAQIILIEIGA